MRAFALPATMACLALMAAPAFANPKVPDLTKGEKPVLTQKMKKPLSGNLGPTGLIGWVYRNRTDTSLSRQILVAEVAQRSPTAGIIKEGAVIPGASGASNPPGTARRMPEPPISPPSDTTQRLLHRPAAESNPLSA